MVASVIYSRAKLPKEIGKKLAIDFVVISVLAIPHQPWLDGGGLTEREQGLYLMMFGLLSGAAKYCENRSHILDWIRTVIDAIAYPPGGALLLIALGSILAGILKFLP